jgi:hypothetical protein
MCCQVAGGEEARRTAVLRVATAAGGCGTIFGGHLLIGGNATVAVASDDDEIDEVDVDWVEPAASSLEHPQLPAVVPHVLRYTGKA